MNRKEAQELFDRYAANLCTPEERTIVERWYQQEADSQELPDVKNISTIKEEIWTGTLLQAGLPRRKPALRVWLPAAAAILIFLSAGFYFLVLKQQEIPGSNYVKEDVAPGGSKAVLVLADGSEIILDHAKNGTLLSQGNVSINKTGNGQLRYNMLKSGQGAAGKLPALNTILTPRGGQYHIILPDGTRVWLNASSSIKFPMVFSGRERNVEITGEAYFEVVSNPAMPFIVKAGETNIRVLGTHFNVMAYADEQGVNTTLLEGKVKVSSGNTVNVMKPGQQALVLNGTINITTANVEEAVAWKNGYFYFKDSDIKTVMRQISRWYDVDVEYKGSLPETVFSGKMYRNVNMSKVLEVLSYFKIDYNITDSKIHKGKKTILIL
ncbi:FecR family protein [Pedobacter heparinus]|uniref:FecR family protein n=1 Tax=Pedobacter heparinus TaxID=984 RepID=UPI0029314D89|nr:FecR domain-containing protein [Pedobacter heparinus]